MQRVVLPFSALLVACAVMGCGKGSTSSEDAERPTESFQRTITLKPWIISDPVSSGMTKERLLALSSSARRSCMPRWSTSMVKELTLTSTQIIGPGLEHLKGMAILEMLDLDHSAITEAGREVSFWSPSQN